MHPACHSLTSNLEVFETRSIEDILYGYSSMLYDTHGGYTIVDLTPLFTTISKLNFAQSSLSQGSSVTRPRVWPAPMGSLQ